MKKLNNENEIMAFILGVQYFFSMGEIIQKEKDLKWQVIKTNEGYDVKAKWVLEIVKSDRILNPVHEEEEFIYFDYHKFSIGFNDSLEILCDKILNSLEDITKHKLEV